MAEFYSATVEGRQKLWARLTVQVIEVITEPKGQLHFGPPKTSAGRRMVGLPPFVVDALAERLATPGAPEELVFAGSQGGALRVTLFRRRFWLPATRAAGLGGLRIHDLRHTAVAGHASVSFTLDRYGHLYPEADLTLGSDWTRSGRPAEADRESSQPQRGPSGNEVTSRSRNDGEGTR